MIDRTLEQWNVIMKNKWSWFANVLMGEERIPVYAYHQIPRFGLELMKTSISGVQQIRSQNIQMIRKELAFLPTEKEEK